MTLWLWLAFLLVVGTLIVIDLGLVTRRPRVVTRAEALASFSLWVAAAVGFSLLVWHVYQTNWLDLETALAEAIPRTTTRKIDLDGHTAWLQWVTAYVLEVALSLDNVAIAALLLRHFQIPRPLVSRTLFWTVLISLVARMLMILGGAYLLQHVAWVKWGFCGLLVLAMLRTLIAPDEHTDFSKRWPVRMLKKVVPISPNYEGQRLFTRVDGKLGITPIMLVVLVSSAADLSFAIDSVPAMFSVTRDPFLAFTASAFAILGLRSLYFALTGVLGRFRYLRVSLVFVLLCAAGKMFLVSTNSAYFGNRPTLVMLSLVAGIMAIGVGMSALRRLPAVAREEVQEPLRPAPLEDLTEAVDVTRRNLRKVVILIVGSTIALIGVVIVGPLPGPGGIPVILLGLTILATEFIWARRLLNRLKEQTMAMAARADRAAEKTSPWLVPPAILGVVGAVVALAHLGPFKPSMVYVFGVGPMIAVGYWAFITLRAWRRQGRPTATKPDAGGDAASVKKPEARQNPAA